MSWQTDLPVSHRDWHLTVVEEPGWIARSAGLWAYGLPKAHLLHQFVIAYGVPDMNAVNMLINGYNTGSYFLYGPVANQYLGQTGVVYMIGGGLAQHAGQGVRRVFDNAAADRPPVGDGQNAPGADDWGGGSACYLGTESHHPGNTSPFRQYEQAVLMGASLCEVFGWTEYRCLEHSNHSTRKAQDLVSIDGNQMRRDIRTALNTGHGTVPPNPDGWLTVAAEANILTAIASLPTAVWSKGITSDDKGGHANEILAAINALVRGLDARVEKALQDALTPILAAIQNAALTAAVNPQGGRYGMVADDTTGAVYAVSPGQFWHIPNSATLTLGQRMGLYDNDIHHTDAVGIVTVRRIALAGKDDGDPIVVPTTVNYTVVAGDTLGSIAAAHNTTVAAILALNGGITNPDDISVGQVLRIPKA